MTEQQWNRDHYLPNRHTIQRYWGTCQAAVQATGLMIQPSAKEQRRQQWLADWQRLSAQLGHPATRMDWETWTDHPAPNAIVWKILGWPLGKTLRWHIPSICQQLRTIDPESITDVCIRHWRWPFCQGTTLEELAQISGLTQEGVRQRIIRTVQKAQADQDVVKNNNWRESINPSLAPDIDAEPHVLMVMSD
ncbi:MAG: hypothetical protein C7B46_19760 [Sulfobacillus benefaciens]|uniref:Uncharacterized protein n=1 Tax=Sulfobacillus benefaciens TaxID=453960 RepID=A0A2T2WWY5_9FIRM|nr:MAG: hypothetical protein C7B46_19760 [Sulfobacillus benefaciens]